jgi:microcystin-dependent protein
MSFGQETSSQTANKLRSTFVYGNLGNFDKSDGTPANAAFQRNLLVGGNLTIGTETIDPSGNAIDSNSNIKFTLNKVPYTIPLRILSYIQNVSSDIQQQINTISASSGNISTLGYITQTLSDITSTQFGLNAFNKTLLSTANLYNSAFGGNTLYNNTTGNFNTAVGHSAGFANTTGSLMTAIGQQALAKNTSGNYNTAVGFVSSSENTTGSANTSMGSHSLLNNISGSYNTAIGFFSANENTSGSSNSSFGFDTLRYNTTGTNNSAFGYHALRNNTTGYNNIALGSSSGKSMLATIESTCVGTNSDTSFNYSTAIGSNSTCTADRQIMLGTTAETVVIPGSLTVSGKITQSLVNPFSTQLGTNALLNLTSDGNSNTCIGVNSGYYTSTGDNNSSLGANAMQGNSTGSDNTCIGYNAMVNGTTAFQNTIIGSSSGNSISTGSYNTCIGYRSSSSLSTGSTNTTIGYNSSADNYSYSTALGYSATNTASHQIMLGTLNETVVVPNDITFGGSINEIPRTTLSYIKNVSSDVQQQLNSISNTNPIGSVIQFAGNASSLNGYLQCDGTLYTISSYQNLYNVIGTMYGGDASLGYFNVPNYQGVFLRGAGSQNLDLVAGSPAKQYSSPGLGIFVVDKSVQPSNYVTSINQSVKSFLERANSNIIGLSFTTSNAVSSLQYSTASDTGVVETFPVHTSIQYFIKY